MTTPLFITGYGQQSPKWVKAFSDIRHSVGLPDRFDKFDSSIIFVDLMGLSTDDQQRWLDTVIASGRKVIVLSPTPNEAQALSVIKLGAVGYGHSLATSARLREMSLVVSHGGLWVGNQLLKRVLSGLEVAARAASQQTPDAAAVRQEKLIESTLSGRELVVARQVATGATNGEISAALKIKERTVKAHITSIFDKLKVRNRVELALFLNNVQSKADTMDNSSNRTAL